MTSSLQGELKDVVAAVEEISNVITTIPSGLVKWNRCAQLLVYNLLCHEDMVGSLTEAMFLLTTRPITTDVQYLFPLLITYSQK